MDARTPSQGPYFGRPAREWWISAPWLARGVAMVKGQWVIVGYGYTKKDGIMRAVVWKPDAQGNYGAPIRLAALGGRSSAWARAEGINSSGQVVGTSAGNGLTRFAVMWLLP